MVRFYRVTYRVLVRGCVTQAELWSRVAWREHSNVQIQIDKRRLTLVTVTGQQVNAILMDPVSEVPQSRTGK
jgi:hypothetical protein